MKIKKLIIAILVCGSVGIWAPASGNVNIENQQHEVPNDADHAIPTTISPDEPVEVRVGVYVSDIHSIDLEEQTFRVRFWIWFRWDKAHLRFIRDPLETFDIAGGVIESKSNVFRELFIDNSIYAVARIDALIHQPFELNRFPLDSHVLQIRIQPESDFSYVRYVADGRNSKIDPAITLPGWNIKDLSGVVTSIKFYTSYGYEPPGEKQSAGESEYTEFKYSVQISRPATSVFVKTFWATFLSVILAIMMFAIPQAEPEVRFNLGVGSIFAATANYYIVSGAASAPDVFTLADAVSLFSVLTILLAIGGAALSLVRFASDSSHTTIFSKRAAGSLGLIYIVGIWAIAEFWGAL